MINNNQQWPNGNKSNANREFCRSHGEVLGTAGFHARFYGPLSIVWLLTGHNTAMCIVPKEGPFSQGKFVICEGPLTQSIQHMSKASADL
jgi:hypothetical protein